MVARILITGSSGLVGTALTAQFLADGVNVVSMDLRAGGPARGDVRDAAHVRNLVSYVNGIVHLAAVSRVIWAERDPAFCRATNIGGLRNVLDAVAQSPRSPWLVFASSREVYGQPDSLPTTEAAPLRPVNVYGRSKVQGEHLVEEARGAGLRASIVRLSNVFGSASDHADRVVPAFARAAALGDELRVDGLEHTFDFTHVDDVARGIARLAQVLEFENTPPPPIHLVSGQPTTLGQLATLAVQLGAQGSPIRSAAPRDFDVARFYGDPSRARELLGWRPRVDLEVGLARLIQEFRAVHRPSESQEAVR